MLKFIHSADIHLDSPLYGLERYPGAPVDTIRGATRQAMENLVSLAIEESVAFILIAGDLYDGDLKDYNTALFLSKELARMKDAGIRVFIISGNHDASSRMTKSIGMPDNVKWFSSKRPETVILGEIGVAIHGQGFHQRAVLDDLSSGYPEGIRDLFNIGILHTSASGSEGHEPYAPCKIETLLSKNYGYWALGHIHKRAVLHKDPWIVFSGNTQGRNIRETGPKGCTLVTVEDNRSVSVDHKDLHVLQWAECRIDVAGADTPEQIIDISRSHIEKVVEQMDDQLFAVRMIFEGACRAHDDLIKDPVKWVNEIRASVTDMSRESVWVEKIKMQTQARVDIAKVLSRNDPFSDLLRYISGVEKIDELPQSFIDDLMQLKSKLPRELLSGEEAISLDSPEFIRDIIKDAKQLLISRLLSRGDGR